MSIGSGEDAAEPENTEERRGWRTEDSGRRHQRLSSWRMLLGLTVAAATGHFAYLVFQAGALATAILIGKFLFGHTWTESDLIALGSSLLGVGVVSFVFGFPMALGASVAVGFPIWRFSDSKANRTPRHAAVLGALVGALLGFMYSFAVGMAVYLSENTSYDEFRLGFQVVDDGIPTLVGVIYEIVNILFFAAAGVVAGLFAHLVAIPRAQRR